MKFYISTILSTKKKLPETIEYLCGAGFRNIELTGNISYCNNIESVLKEYIINENCDFLIHNYIPFEAKPYVINLASSNKAIIDKTIIHIKKAVTLLLSINRYYYSLHPGYFYDLLPIIQDNFFIKENYRQNNIVSFYNMLLFINEKILKKNFTLAIENLHPKEKDDTYSFICTPEDIMRYLQFIRNIPNYGLLLDLGHLNIASEKLGFNKFHFLDELFSKYSKKIFQIHISDNNGEKDSHDICSHNSWQIDYLYHNKNNLSGIPVTMEWSYYWRSSAFKAYQKITDRIYDKLL